MNNVANVSQMQMSMSQKPKSSHYLSTKSSKHKEEVEEFMFESRIYENSEDFIYRTMTKKVFKSNDLFK